MSKIHNPFMVYGYAGPEYFCDRETETRKLSDALYNGRNVTLMSPRRVGKTGLIHNVFYTLQNKYPDAVCFYVDIYATRSLADFVKAFGETVLGTLDKISDKVKGTAYQILTHCKISYSSEHLLGGSVTLEFSKEDTEATLRDIFAYLMQADKEIYIAFDEFQTINDYPETNVEALLRTYVQQCPTLHFVFSGSKAHMMSAMFDTPHRPFFRSTEKMTLGVVDREKYYLFAQHHLQAVMTVLPQETFNFIYQSFEGHTWYVQYILNKLYSQSLAVIEIQDVEECIQEIVLENTNDFQRQCRMLTNNQYALLRAIACSHTVKSINGAEFIRKYDLPATSSINKALRYLVDNEFVYQYPDGYQVYDRFFALWLKRQNL